MADIMENAGKNSPRCIGFIMDGNRRWAKQQGKESLVGHDAGKEVFARSVGWLRDFGIEHGVYYGFSTENWHRSPEEVAALESLFNAFITERLATVHEDKVRVRFLGRRSDWSEHLQENMQTLEKSSGVYDSPTIWVALSYGGRAEILDAVNRAVEKGTHIPDEQSFTALLDTANLPEPDLVIRTGGEQRLSNFLTWHTVYSELYFTETYWPAFTKDELDRILTWYGARERRRGR